MALARSRRRLAQRTAATRHHRGRRFCHHAHARCAPLQQQVRSSHLCRATGAPGLALEFGVFKGTTINHLARAAPERHFFGFDSFEGLPEHWTGARYSPVNFDRRGKKPRVPANVSLIKGWFDATLPAFLAREMGRIGFIHVDCDIYASTKTVLELTVPRLMPGALVVYELHEYKAFFEVTERFDLA